jgi:predicted RNase H-like HicB family nuclease
MRTVEYVCWNEESAWLGYLEEFPDYWTQGDTLEDLIENLKDLHLDVVSGQISGT